MDPRFQSEGAPDIDSDIGDDDDGDGDDEIETMAEQHRAARNEPGSGRSRPESSKGSRPADQSFDSRHAPNGASHDEFFMHTTMHNYAQEGLHASALASSAGGVNGTSSSSLRQRADRYANELMDQLRVLSRLPDPVLSSSGPLGGSAMLPSMRDKLATSPYSQPVNQFNQGKRKSSGSLGGTGSVVATPPPILPPHRMNRPGSRQSLGGSQRPLSASSSGRPRSAPSTQVGSLGATGSTMDSMHHHRLAPSSPDSSGTAKAAQRIRGMFSKVEDERKRLDAEINATEAEMLANTSRKVEEANDLMKLLKKANRSYRLQSTTTKGRVDIDQLRVEVIEDDKVVKELSMNMFEREFRSLKEKERARSRKAKLPPGGATRNTRAVQAPHVLRQETKDQLRAVLLETIQLTSKLRDQINEMERKGGNFSPFV